MQIKNLQLVQQSGKKYTFLGDFEQASDIYSVDVTLTPAQILDMYQTPIEIVPAPWPNKIIQPATDIVEYQILSGWTTDYSPIFGSPLWFYDYDFGFNPNLANAYNGRQIITNMSINVEWQYLYVTPSSSIFSWMSVSYIHNPINKWVKMWFVIDVNNTYTPPSVGDRNITFRFNYRILDLSFTPILNSTQYPFTLKTSCTWGAFTPFDGTETNWAITRLYTFTSSDILPDFVLNPVYEWAWVWNLWDWIVYNSANLNQQSWWACYISCVKWGQTIYFSTRRTFGSIAGTILSINASYIV